MQTIPHLAHPIELDTLVVKVLQYLLGIGILFNFAVEIKADHIAGRYRRAHLEVLFQAFLLGRSHTSIRHVYSEVYGRVGMMLFIVLRSTQATISPTDLDGGRDLISPSGEFFEHLFEILRPPSYGQFGHFQSRVVHFLEDSAHFVLVDIYPLD